MQTIESVWSFLMIFISILALISFAKNLAHEEDLTVLGYKPIYIVSESMESSNKDLNISRKSIIISKKVKDTNNLQVGDVITYSAQEYDETFSGTYTTHRIVSLNEDKTSFRAKGDANNLEDVLLIDGYETRDLPIDTINFKLVLRMNWVASVLSAIKEKPLVVGLYSISLVTGLMALFIIHRQIYDKQYEYNFKLFKSKSSKNLFAHKEK